MFLNNLKFITENGDILFRVYLSKGGINGGKQNSTTFPRTNKDLIFFTLICPAALTISYLSIISSI